MIFKNYFSFPPLQLLPAKQKTRYPAALAILLDEVKAHYSENLREGTINMMIRNPELEAIQAEAIKKDVYGIIFFLLLEIKVNHLA